MDLDDNLVVNNLLKGFLNNESKIKVGREVFHDLFKVKFLDL